MENTNPVQPPNLLNLDPIVNPPKQGLRLKIKAAADEAKTNAKGLPRQNPESWTDKLHNLSRPLGTAGEAIQNLGKAIGNQMEAHPAIGKTVRYLLIGLAIAAVLTLMGLVLGGKIPLDSWISTLEQLKNKLLIIAGVGLLIPIQMMGGGLIPHALHFQDLRLNSDTVV